MRTAYLTDTPHAGLKARDLLIGLGMAMLVLTVVAGLISGLTPSVPPATVEMSQGERIEDVSMYILDKDAEFVGL